MSKKTQLCFKLVLLGDAAVGKSSCVERFVKNEFFEFQQPTIGAAFLTQSIGLDDYIVKFEIWDTAGEDFNFSRKQKETRLAQSSCPTKFPSPKL